MTPRISATVTIAKAALQTVFDNLRASGFQLAGPTVRDAAIVLDELTSIEELPVGWTDEQSPSRYRLRQAGDSYFNFNVGAGSWKRFLQPPRLPLFSATRSGGSFEVTPAKNDTRPYACIGVRACDLAALGALDRVFMGGTWIDPTYAARRESMFTLAVQCAKAADTCFCTSMKTGPRVTGGFDLSLTELPNAFVIEVGSEAGSEAMRDTGWVATTAFDQGRATQLLQMTERQVSRQLKTDDLPRLLMDNLEHPEWQEVAQRCLSCGNCTMVCPTCFCSTVSDSMSLEARATTRARLADSCYSTEFSHVHGGNLRPTVRSRYRQWLTHKFSTYQDQFGVSGCVGCGRCMTWCPVGIEVTEEINAIRETRVR